MSDYATGSRSHVPRSFSLSADRSKKNHRGPQHGRQQGSNSRRSQGGLRIRRLTKGDGWEFVHPRAAVERAEDLEEVRAMIEGGEIEIALDELRFLLSGCSDFIEAHALLGEIAAQGTTDADIDMELARGHFGYGFQLGERAIDITNCPGPIPGSERANAPWYDAAFGLVWCFEKQGKWAMADRIVAIACGMDPTDPAGIRAMLDDLRSGGLPMIELGPLGS